ncbi:MAG: four helix bundle protein [Alphaproteobacteria bacterium]
MSAISSYRDLLVWKQAIDLAVDLYAATRAWPKDELYGLTSQVRRSATSVAANIAEGYGRENKGSYVQFLKVAQGSLKELETHLIIAERIGIVQTDAANRLLGQCESIGKLLRALMRKVQQSDD